MMRLLTFFLCLILLVSIGFISCKDTTTNPSSEIVFPDSKVSFTKHVEPLLHQKCAQSSCHGGSAPEPRPPGIPLNLEYPSYTKIISRNGFVTPGEVNNSRLVQVIVGNPPLMPLSTAPQLTQNQITGIKKWIEEGAQYN